MKASRTAVLSAWLAVLGWGVPARAVLLYATPQRNTWAPSGTLAGAGWQYEGKWGAFLGTPIAPRLFITAGHVGGALGQPFSFRGKTYTTRAMFDDPNSDLRIWQVDRPFTDAYAPLYRGTGEVGKQVVMLGRGTQRGADVVVNGQRKGWRWGANDGLMSWGTNTVSTVVNGGAGIGAVLHLAFDAAGGRNEGTLSGYDSGGGDFVNDNGVWKLAGVNFAAKGSYSLAGATGGGFDASIYDEGGLYVGPDGRRWYVPDAAANAPGGSFVTRVSAEMGWIDSVMRTTGNAGLSAGTTAVRTTTAAVPEPRAVTVLLVALGAALAARRGR